MRLNLFDSLPDLLKDSAVELSISKGQRLFRQGDRADYLYLIQRGRFQEISYLGENEIAVLQTLNSGETAGEASLLSQAYNSTVIARTKAIVIAYPKSILLETLAQSPSLVSTVLEILIQKINELQARLSWRSISLADRRVLKYLQHQLEKQTNEDTDSQITLNASLQEIAAELGFVPGTLSRALAKLEAEQTITRSKNRITLHDTDVA